MKKILYILLTGLCVGTNAADNFAKDKLIAWCIVPFDAKQRGPAARAAMLKKLGLKRVAYDWRTQHVKEFEEEILQYKKHGLEFFAFWKGHEEAFRLFEKHKIHPQIWRTLRSPQADSQEARVAAAAQTSTRPPCRSCTCLRARAQSHARGPWFAPLLPQTGGPGPWRGRAPRRAWRGPPPAHAHSRAGARA